MLSIYMLPMLARLFLLPNAEKTHHNDKPHIYCLGERNCSIVKPDKNRTTRKKKTIREKSKKYIPLCLDKSTKISITLAM